MNLKYLWILAFQDKGSRLEKTGWSGSVQASSKFLIEVGSLLRPEAITKYLYPIFLPLVSTTAYSSGK